MKHILTIAPRGFGKTTILAALKHGNFKRMLARYKQTKKYGWGSVYCWSEFVMRNIMMFGQRQFGKTAQLAAIANTSGYGTASAISIDPEKQSAKEVITQFSISARDDDQAADLEVIWARLITGKGGDRKLRPTEESILWKFRFDYNLDTVFDFDMYDYAGQDIGSNSSNEQKLKDATLDSIGMFIFVPAYFLLESVTRKAHQSIADFEDLRYKLGIKKYERYLKNFADLTRARGTRLPVSIVITMWDLMLDPQGSGWASKRPFDEIEHDIRTLFPVLFNEANDKLEVLIVPVSIGMGLGTDWANGKIEPQNVETPFIFVIHRHLQYLLSEVEKSTAENDTARERARELKGQASANLSEFERKNFIRFLDKHLNEGSALAKRQIELNNANSQIHGIYEKSQKLSQMHSKFIKDIDRLGTILSGEHVFIAGKRKQISKDGKVYIDA